MNVLIFITAVVPFITELMKITLPAGHEVQQTSKLGTVFSPSTYLTLVTAT